MFECLVESRVELSRASYFKVTMEPAAVIIINQTIAYFDEQANKNEL